jgi:hypothetical protein
MNKIREKAVAQLHFSEIYNSTLVYLKNKSKEEAAFKR